ncbi:MAG: hypothetical protein RLZZ165_1329 [Bacteroidota bacterium]|jgi:phage baseplate assembly protein W
MEKLDFIGRGWSFPPKFGSKGASVAMVTGSVDIYQSLQILVTTRVYERLMHPNYGLDLTPFLFEGITEALCQAIDQQVRKTVEEFEPRIRIDRLSVSARDAWRGRVMIEMQFSIKGTNSRLNFVHPFDLIEATAGQ